MALASQQVLEAVAAALRAGATGSGVRVYTDRFHPIAQYPATRVRHVGEEVNPADGDDITWPPRLLHELQVEVQVLVQATTGLDAALAQGAQQALAVLFASPTPLAPLPVALQWQALRYEAQAEGAATTGTALLRLQASFHTEANAPEVLV